MENRREEELTMEELLQIFRIYREELQKERR
jgi:hypothetical protein